jgi:spermidine synthase
MMRVPETNFYEPSGAQFVTVNRQNNLVQLVYLDQSFLTSQLVQSELDLSQPYHLTAPYSQGMMLSLACLESMPQSLYMAGLGGGRLPFVLRHYCPDLKIECTEIDPLIVEVAKTYFGIREDEKLHISIADGRVYLENLPPEVKYEVIMVDVVLGTGYSPYRMATTEFYETCQKHLTNEGVIALSLFQVEPFFGEKMQTLCQSFAQVYVCKFPNGNTVALATNNPHLTLDSIQTRAKLLMAECKFSFPLAERSSQLEKWETAGSNLPCFYDDQPPPSYFDLLPYFNTLFSQVEDHLPCPCGSGRNYGTCHGAQDI